MNISTAFVYCFLVVLAGVVVVEGLSDRKRSTEQEDIGEGRRLLSREGNDALYHRPHETCNVLVTVWVSLSIL